MKHANRGNRVIAAAFTLLVAIPIMQLANAAEAERRVEIDWAKLQSVTAEPIAAAKSDWTVVSFLGTECPLTKLYGQRLSSLRAEFESQGVRFVGVNSNPQDSLADIKQYIKEFGIAFPIVKDADQSIAELFQAQRTPEVFVLDSTARVRYRGRIDDQYEPGKTRAEPSKHELRDAIAALVAGRSVPQPETAAVGCLITKIAKNSPPDGTANVKVTFARDVAPILNRRCVECHRTGEIGPFALTDYNEVIGWGQMMLEVIDQGRMPPWHADPAHGKFVGERRIPSDERAVLAAWVNQGMPVGDLANLPAQPKWSAGWHLPTTPDIELAMRDRPFVVPKEGTVDYQYFVVDPHWTEDRWVSAAQVIPGDPAVVHHAIVFVRPPDGSDSHGIGWLGAYVPGQRTMQLPPGHARRVPAGSRLVFQMHYTPNGRATADRTRVGVWFADPQSVTHDVFTLVALDHNFEIPPNAKDHKVQMQLDGFDTQSRLLTVMPHMHLRGKSFRIEAVRGNDRETLLAVPKYDFNWQHCYQLESSLPLAPIDALNMEVSFDNSPQNPVNPAPDEYVTWGDQTWNEMAVAFLDISHPRGVPWVEQSARAKTGSNDAPQSQQLEQRVKEFLAKMDRNADEVVLREEAPLTFQRFGFRQMDQNGDGQLDRIEIETAAAKRL
jgi:peroxiredoxin